jgi:hypothetical protein
VTALDQDQKPFDWIPERACTPHNGRLFLDPVMCFKELPLNKSNKFRIIFEGCFSRINLKKLAFRSD